MKRIRFTVMCALESAGTHEKMHRVLSNPYGVLRLSEVENTLGFWVDPQGVPVMEPGMMATYEGSVDYAKEFAQRIAQKFNQQYVQLTVQEGEPLTDYQLVFPIRDTIKHTVLEKLMSAGVRGGTTTNTNLRVNVTESDRLHTYDIIKQVCKSDGEIKPVSFFSVPAGSLEVTQ